MIDPDKIIEPAAEDNDDDDPFYDEIEERACDYVWLAIFSVMLLALIWFVL